MKRNLPIVIIAGVLILALGGGYILWQTSKKATDQPFTQPTPTATATTQASPTTTPISQQSPPPGPDSPHARGNLSARVTLEEYGDYQCPSCGAVFHLLKTLEKDYDDKVRFVFRQYPLPGHKHALLAAHVAEAAALQNHFWEMHDMLYQNQQTWSVEEEARPIFIQYAKDLGLDVDRFTKDIDSPEVAARVTAGVDRGKMGGVEGTPTIFINGQQGRPEV